jgi:muramoyltetrapeptide carboxypeptidase
MSLRPIMPKALRRGDGVAIVSTSSPVTSAQLNTVITYVAACGYRPVPAPGVLASTGYLAGSREQRADDLMSAFSDPDIRLILPATGGVGASQLLDILEYDIIAANPKLFVGLSDPSIVCNAIYAMTNIVTVHGPTGFNFFQDPVNDETAGDFWRIVSEPIAGRMISSPQWRIARPGCDVIEGRVIGGNLSNIRSLIGTRFMPRPDGAILLLEEFGSSWEDIDHYLTHLKLAGIFDRIAALIWGVPVECSKDNAADRTLDELIVRCAPGDFPVITNLLVGHASHIISMPIGGAVRIDMSKDAVELTFCEDLVAI